MSCALRVNTSTKSTSITFGEGQQNGAGDASPLRLLLQGRCAVLFYAGAARYPHTPGLVRSWLRHHRALFLLWCGRYAVLWGAVSR